MNQEQIIEIANAERQAHEMEEQLRLIDAQISELDNFRKGVEEIVNSKDREMLSSLGGRVYLKTKFDNVEKLFVEVGAGIVVQKSPADTLDIVKGQISRLKEVRMQISSQLEVYYKKLKDFVNEINEND